MAKDKSITASWLTDLFQVGLYKRNQGRVARQVTFAALAITVALGAWRMSVYWVDQEAFYRYAIPGIVLLAGLWISYRAVNMPNFADFLISVEGEMAKVSWPGRPELLRSSAVVIVTIIVLAALLYSYDLLWRELLTALQVLN